MLVSPSSSPSHLSATNSQQQHEPSERSHHIHSSNRQALSTSSTVTNSTSVGSRVVQGIEELRSALSRHSVAPPSSSSVPSASSLSGIAGDRHVVPAAEHATRAADDPTGSSSTPGKSKISSSQPPPPPPSATTTTKASAPMRKTDKATQDERSDSNETTGTTATSSTATGTTTPSIRPSDSDVDDSQSKRLRPAKPPVKILPASYEYADPRDIVVLISSMLMELIQFNDKIPLNQGRLTRFHSRSPPRISVQDYLQRLTTHATLSPPLLLSMVYYIDRLCAFYPAFTVSSLTIHRFLIASATVASKGLSDSFWTNKTYARIGGVSLAELSLLELEFLFRVEWMIVPQPEVLVDYYQSLVERCEGYEVQQG